MESTSFLRTVESHSPGSWRVFNSVPAYDSEQHSSLAFRLEDIREVNKIKVFITMRTKISFLFLTTLLILSGCNSTPSNSTNGTASPPATNAKEAEIGSKQVQESEPNLPKKLPTPTIQSESGTSIPAVQGSYCWSGTCADYVGGKDLLKGHTPMSALVGEKVSIDMGIDIPPDELDLFEYVDEKIKPLALTKESFHLPQEPGTHYYGASVRWTSSQDSQISYGSTSFAFVVRVVEKK
ncbi:hypothetical protein HW560_33175 [Paenibacillus sp. E222]|uniref:hypothetical protein n=1 Tax=Paenibacillus sp. E222 TaxID=2748863 RepID=UPI0015C5CB05|nr:hypothetical protein [Paenibacillus sp. E222]QLG42497.1 hypothetical protein HW560_33175 [Paenibacillus sp. E222]